jgi:hypothetical protein
MRFRPTGVFWFCLLASTACFASSSFAQRTEVTIRALNGKTGSPFANQRLVIFVGESAEAATFHQRAIDAQTDKNGLVVIPVVSAKTSWIQVWADGLTLCQSEPNRKSFSVDMILSSGLSAPNNCGSLAQATAPGQFTVYARPATFSEKMAR